MYILETDRLRMRRFTPEDRQSIASVLMDEEIMRAMHLPPNDDFVDSWLQRMLARYESHGPANWYVERKEDGAFVGIMGVMADQANGMVIAEVGWVVHRSHQRQGYALEGAGGCIKYAFETLGADFVTARIAADNMPSRSLAERFGMTSIEQQTYLRNGVPVDYLIYALAKPL